MSRRNYGGREGQESLPCMLEPPRLPMPPPVDYEMEEEEEDYESSIEETWCEVCGCSQFDHIPCICPETLNGQPCMQLARKCGPCDRICFPCRAPHDPPPTTATQEEQQQQQQEEGEEEEDEQMEEEEEESDEE